jgi:hypothetical protein
MIAAGVGIGVTIVMFGGYKIIKQIKAAGNANEESMDEMMRLNTDVGSVERWRRGVANIEATSVGTSVDGEFITPKAAAMSGILQGGRDGYSERNAPSDTVSNSSRGSMVSRTSRATRREASDKGKKGKKKSDKKKKTKPVAIAIQMILHDYTLELLPTRFNR